MKKNLLLLAILFSSFSGKLIARTQNAINLQFSQSLQVREDTNLGDC